MAWTPSPMAWTPSPRRHLRFWTAGKGRSRPRRLSMPAYLSECASRVDLASLKRRESEPELWLREMLQEIVPRECQEASLPSRCTLSSHCARPGWPAFVRVASRRFSPAGLVSGVLRPAPFARGWRVSPPPGLRKEARLDLGARPVWISESSCAKSERGPAGPLSQSLLASRLLVRVSA
jgi:hypothetical protein